MATNDKQDETIVPSTERLERHSPLKPEPSRFEAAVVMYPCCCCWLWFGVSMLFTGIAFALLGSGTLNFDQRGVWDVRDHEVQKQWDGFQLARQENAPPENSAPQFATRTSSLFTLDLVYYADEANLLTGETMKWAAETEQAMMATSFKDTCQLVRGVDSQTYIDATGITSTGAVQAASGKPLPAVGEILLYVGSNGWFQDGGLYHVASVASSGNVFEVGKLNQEVKIDVVAGLNQANAANGGRFYKTKTSCAAASSLPGFVLPNQAAMQDELCTNGFAPSSKVGGVSVLRDTRGCSANSLVAYNGNGQTDCSSAGFGENPECMATNFVTPSTADATDAKVKANIASKFCAQSLKSEPFWKQMKTKLFPTSWTCDQPTTFFRSTIPFGAPLTGFTRVMGDEADKQMEEMMKVAQDSLYAEVVEVMNDAGEKAPEGVKVTIMSSFMLTVAFNTIMSQDGMLAFGSIFIVFMWVWCSTGSTLLALGCVFECIISLPMAMAVWGMLGQKYLGFLCIMVIFIILGIGADDVFVLTDAWKQSALQGFGDDIQARFCWAHRRARNAMFVTTMTTVFSLLAAGISDVPSISGFGLFGALVVLLDYIMCITFFSALVVVYHKYFEGKNACCGDKRCISHMLCCPCACLNVDRGIMRNPRVIVPAVLLFILGLICAFFIPMLGVSMMCAGVIYVYAVISVQADPTIDRPIEKFFKTSFMTCIVKCRWFCIVGWLIVMITGLALLILELKLPTEEAPFLSSEHPLQKYLSLSGKFSAGGDNPILWSYVVFGLKKDDAIDRSGVDFQQPGSAWGKMTPDDPLGKVKYSTSAAQNFLSPAGQVEVVDLCDSMSQTKDIATSDDDCSWVVWNGVGFPRLGASTSSTSVPAQNGGKYRTSSAGSLSSVGNGFCSMGVYCFMHAVRDYLEEFCNYQANFKQKWVTAGTWYEGISPNELCTLRFLNGQTEIIGVGSSGGGFPNQQMEAVLASNGYKYYYDKVIVQTWFDNMLTYDYSRRSIMTGVAMDNNQFKMAFIGMNSSIPGTQMTYHELSDLMDKFTNYFESRLKVNSDAFVSSFLFCWKLITDALVKNTYQALAIGIVLCFCVITATTCNWIVSALSILSVIVVVATACGVIVVMGWQLGIIEAIVLIVIVGISVDYSVHVAHAYNECDEEALPAQAKETSQSIRIAKATEAVGTMGISLCSGFATSGGAALFLCFCEVQFFNKFGQFLIITLCISLVVTLTFLMPLLVAVGPTNGRGNCPCVKKKENQRKDVHHSV